MVSLPNIFMPEDSEEERRRRVMMWYLMNQTSESTATAFDGTAYLARGADLTGNADGKLGIFSCWVKYNGGDAGTTHLIYNAGGHFRVTKVSNDKIQIFATNGAGATRLNLLTINTYTAGPTWLHFLSSWNMGVAGSWAIYVNDVSDGAVTTFTDDDLDYAVANWGIAARDIGSNPLIGCMSEIYLNCTETIAESDGTISEANRRKFIDAAGSPVDLGTDGSDPTGSQPIIYYPNPNTSLVNLGSGGDFSVGAGSLSACATNP